jgi:hypothetical protein
MNERFGLGFASLDMSIPTSVRLKKRRIRTSTFHENSSLRYKTGFTIRCFCEAGRSVELHWLMRRFFEKRIGSVVPAIIVSVPSISRVCTSTFKFARSHHMVKKRANR